MIDPVEAAWFMAFIAALLLLLPWENRMVPKTYCSTDGGHYKPWNNGNVDPAVLANWKVEQDSVYVRGVLVYAFCFETEHGPKIWTCKFGWLEKGML